MPVLRAIAVLSTFVALTLLLIPVQAVLCRLPGNAKRRIPYHYHRLVVRILGIRVDLSGEVPADGPVLLVSNHQSWIDIPALSAVVPLSFISKQPSDSLRQDPIFRGNPPESYYKRS